MGAELLGAASLNATADEIADKWAGSYHFEASTGVEYAIFVEFGTKRHDITPNSKEALHFWVDGVEVITRYVDHPGADPRPFMQPGAEAAARNTRRVVAESNDLKELTEKLTELVRDMAKLYAPVESGRLMASITVRRVS